MKKMFAMVLLLLAFCSSAFAADANTSEVAKDYQAMLGGDNAVVEMTERNVMAAIADLKVYGKLDSVVLPKGLKNYRIIRAGNEQAFLIIPHFARTRITVLKAATRKEEGALKGVFEGRSLVLFCNKGDALIEMLVRNGHGIQMVSFVPEAEELQENGQPGGVVISERKQCFLKDITTQIAHDGEIIKVE
ncbi:MAG: hypothetical protein IJV12_06780 [Acidaminococcaceae bacterium]|nr:hypothetical protein [Acidaminococcaceae bacterium]